MLLYMVHLSELHTFNAIHVFTLAFQRNSLSLYHVVHMLCGSCIFFIHKFYQWRLTVHRTSYVTIQDLHRSHHFINDKMYITLYIEDIVHHLQFCPIFPS